MTLVVQLGRKICEKSEYLFNSEDDSPDLGNLLASFRAYINWGTSMVSSQTRVLKELYLLPQRPQQEDLRKKKRMPLSEKKTAGAGTRDG
jgi:hypothetical protein